MARFSFLRKAAIAAAVSIVSLPAMAQTTWIMATGYPDNNFLTQNVKEFIKGVETRTHGELKIDLRDNNSLIKLAAIKRAVQGGQVQIGDIRLGNYGNEDPMFDLGNVPGLASTLAQEHLLMEAQKPYFDKLFGRNNMAILAYAPWPGQGFYTKDPIKSLADIQGLKLRIYSQQTQKMGQKLGAHATILPFAEVPQAISTNMINALWTSAQTGVDVQIWDFLKHFTYTGTMHAKNSIIVNKRALRALPADVRAIVIDEGKKATERGWKLAAEAGKAQEAMLKKHGMTVTEAPKDVLDRIDAIGEELMQDWLKRANPEARKVYENYKAALNG